MGILRLFQVLWVSSGFQELPGVSKENEMRLQCSSQCLFFRSAEQERGSALLLAALLIDQPAINHFAEAKAGHCDVSLRYRRHTPNLDSQVRTCASMRACRFCVAHSVCPSSGCWNAACQLLSLKNTDAQEEREKKKQKRLRRLLGWGKK